MLGRGGCGQRGRGAGKEGVGGERDVGSYYSCKYKRKDLAGLCVSQ